MRAGLVKSRRRMMRMRLGDLAVHAHHFPVAAALHQPFVEAFVQHPHAGGVALPLVCGHEPGLGQQLQLRPLLALAQMARGLAFDDDAQVVELVHHVEVERHDLPALPGQQLQKTFAGQALHGRAQRRAAHRHALCQFALRDAIAGHQREVEDHGLELGMGLVGQGRRCVADRGKRPCAMIGKDAYAVRAKNGSAAQMLAQLAPCGPSIKVPPAHPRPGMPARTQGRHASRRAH